MIWLSLALLVGCSETANLGGASEDSLGALDSREITGLRLEVVPTSLPVSADAATLILPQSIEVTTALVVGSGSRDLGVVDLVDPVELSGVAVGIQSTAIRPVADLPGAEAPIAVAGEVRILHASRLQSYRVPLDAAGAFRSFVVPESDYVLAVVPDDPGMPLTFLDLDASSAVTGLNLDIGSGSAIYGFITVEGAPLANVSVMAEREGVPAALATTNDQGFFEVRVEPGTYTLRSLGRANQVDPVLQVTAIEVPDEGARHDFTYESLDRVLVEGRLEESGGGSLLDAVEVRFTASSIDGLETQLATFQVSDLTEGTFFARVPPGVYDIDVLPPNAENGSATYTPSRVEGVVIDTDTDLGTFALDGLRLVEGAVADSVQSLVPGVVVACREEAFAGRSFTTVTDLEGRFTLQLPQVPLLCTLTPPVERSDVALTRRQFDPLDNATPSFALSAGQTVTGTIQRNGEGEAFVVVELRDSEGALLGSGLTDDEGGWTMQVDLSEVP